MWSIGPIKVDYLMAIRIAAITPVLFFLPFFATQAIMKRNKEYPTKRSHNNAIALGGGNA